MNGEADVCTWVVSTVLYVDVGAPVKRNGQERVMMTLLKQRRYNADISCDLSRLNATPQVRKLYHCA